jgi:hypothetical protein
MGIKSNYSILFDSAKFLVLLASISRNRWWMMDAMSEAPNPEVAVFAAAFELPAAQRRAYLDHACAGDAGQGFGWRRPLKRAGHTS